MQTQDPIQNDLQQIRRSFMEFRNGEVASALRKGGIHHKFIFGLLLPQLASIASGFEKNRDLAWNLWHESEARESRLLAPYLWPIESLPEDEALSLLKEVKSREEADVLSFRLLRHHPKASELATELKEDPEATELQHYAAQALQRNLDALKKTR